MTIATATTAKIESEKGRRIGWYRTPIDPPLLKELNRRSNLKGFEQVLGYYGLYFGTMAAAVYSFEARHWWLAALFVYLHGVVSAFAGGCALHELLHGTVFRTKWLNTLFLRFASLFSWWNHVWFGTSHPRHHAYTLHPPDDLEVTVPTQLPKSTPWVWYKVLVFNPFQAYESIKGCLDTARGQVNGKWNNQIFPLGDPKREELIRWARVLLAFHASVLVASVALAVVLHIWGLLLLPIMLSCGPMTGGWLVYLMSMPQHYGLRDNVADFRTSCRTFTANPICRLLYWQMNYHLDHHMFPTVPCYNLKKLHAAIKHDLPPTPQGIWACWKGMLEINKKLRGDPTYKHDVELPRGVGGSSVGLRLKG